MSERTKHDGDVLRYLDALEANDLETAAGLWEKAAGDAELARALGEVHDGMMGEAGLGEDWAAEPERVREWLSEHFKIVNAANGAKKRRRLRWITIGFITAAAASFIVLTILHLYYKNLTATPQELIILGQSKLLAGSPGSLRVRLINHVTQAALAGVPVEIDIIREGQATSLARFTTNDQGTGEPRFTWPDWPNGAYQLRVTAHTPDGLEIIKEGIELKREWKLMVSTDKPLYQPGQTIRFRAIALRRPDQKPVAGQEAIWKVEDPKGNVIFKQRDTTSKYGIVSGECALAEEILEGYYEVSCRIGGTESKATVNVDKYVLPKFKIDVELDQPFYQPGQKVNGTIHAEYFFGKPVADAAVTVELSAQALEKKLTLRTDQNGRATVAFDIPANFLGANSERGDGSLGLFVQIADTAGQLEERKVSRMVTNRPLRVEVIPEAGQLVRGVSNRVYLWASYADGRPATKARISVPTFDKELIASDLGVAMLEFTPTWPEMNLVVVVSDDRGQQTRQQVELKTGLAQNFLVRTDKAVYNGGETMQISAFGGGVQPIFIDLVQDGQTLLTATVPMPSFRPSLQFDLPATLSGTIELYAYRYQLIGHPVRARRTLYVRPAREILIDAKLDRNEYWPGRQACLTLRLTDEKGTPTPGAVGLAVVDEAVFSVVRQSPLMESTFFNLEKERLQPVYRLFPWTPEFREKVAPFEKQEFEQALFASTNETDSEWHPSLQTESYSGKSNATDAIRDAKLETLAAAWQVYYATLGLFTFLGWCAFLVSWRAQYPKESKILGIVTAILVAFFLGYMAAVRLWEQPVPPFIYTLFGGGGGPGRPEFAGGGGSGDGIEAPRRVREWFPETLLWRPELITDDQGRANLTIDLADSITTWRLSAGAVSADGRLGGAQSSIRVFQSFFVDFNLPVALTRGDEASIPAVVYNYLDESQTVTLKLEQAKWFDLLSPAEQRLELRPREVKAAQFRIRAAKVGRHVLRIDAEGRGVADAVKRPLEIVPDGRLVELIANGSLSSLANASGSEIALANASGSEIALDVPPEAIEGSVKCYVKLYPSTFSQLLEGLDGIFRQPYGCFEQTSSTTYPNLLALEYLRQTKKNLPAVEAKARQYIHLGYQRLLSFEVAGGGFDWFGNPPANRTLTAYGLMEFADMAKVHDVDPKLIERTRAWLLEARQADGSWSPEGHGLADGQRATGELARFGATAYVAWAVFGTKPDAAAAQRTLDFLRSFKAESISDPYLLAVGANALLALDPSGVSARPYLARLEAVKQTSADAKLCWWKQAASSRTLFYGSGETGSVETTALAALALMKSSQHTAAVRGALAWLIAQRDAQGTWHGTQSTVLALKALLAGTGTALGGEKERHIEIALDGGYKKTIVIPADQAEVMQQIDLSDHLTPGRHRLTINESSGTGTGFQVVFRHHVPGERETQANTEPLTINLKYDRNNVSVEDVVAVTATVTNRMPQAAPMVMLDLPIPAGFTVVAEDFAKLVKEKTIAKFQVTPRQIIVYLTSLEPGKPQELQYHLKAAMPVKVTVPAARVYEYYDPEKKGASKSMLMTVKGRE